MKIVARMTKDWIEPFRSLNYLIPVVVKSDHPQFKVGTRLDNGFLTIALREGYDIDLRHKR